ncbi:MAG: hypothetical protein M1831_007195 [Alyxoria varia]|nr:MAG: hypothetical protein M1831_007195 [Alyxoria varia]
MRLQPKRPESHHTEGTPNTVTAPAQELASNETTAVKTQAKPQSATTQTATSASKSMANPESNASLHQMPPPANYNPSATTSNHPMTKIEASNSPEDEPPRTTRTFETVARDETVVKWRTDIFQLHQIPPPANYNPSATTSNHPMTKIEVSNSPEDEPPRTTRTFETVARDETVVKWHNDIFQSLKRDLFTKGEKNSDP